jgi:S-(hydroxymethyl)glutathione dehydrogenase/alcohol dehydrogenase
VRAAVMERVGEGLVVRDDVSPIEPGPGEVRVRIRAAGICHSDLSVLTGTIGQPLPSVLGHEGSGEVVAVGPGVVAPVVGDHVVLAWIAPCGSCRHCVNGEAHLCTVHVKGGMARGRFLLPDGRNAFGMAGCGTWAEEIVVPAAAAVPVDRDVPFELAALLGCGVATGVCAVLRTAEVKPGSTVLVVGCGGVGINVIQGARISGAAAIVAVDPVPEKQAMAREFGATVAVAPDEVGSALAGLGLGKGVDYAFDVVGSPNAIRMAWDRTRRGGTVTVVGVGGTAPTVAFSPAELVFDGKQLRGALFGSADVRRDLPMLVALWRGGRLDLASLISARLDLDEVNHGVDELKAGKVIRQIVTFG